MKNNLRILWIVFIFFCAMEPIVLAQKEIKAPPTNPSNNKQIHVVDHGWHTGIVIAIDDLSKGQLPQHQDFPKAKYLEVGWGDEDIYRAANDITPGMALSAVFWPTDAVLHVVGFRNQVEKFFANSTIVQLTLSQKQFDQLIEFLETSYETSDSQISIPLGKGIYGISRFYRATGTYSIARTCNTWTAEGLQKAGLAVDPRQVLMSEDVMKQVHPLGLVLQERE